MRTWPGRCRGIDLIVSGHTHHPAGTHRGGGHLYCLRRGVQCENLGCITLSWNGAGEKTLKEYRLIPIDGTAGEDPEISALVRDWKGRWTSAIWAPRALL